MLIRSRAPLRIGLAGGGTDVSPYCDEFGGAILNATIDYYAYAALEPLTNDCVEFESADLQESAAYPAQALLQNDGRLDLFKAVYNHVVRNFNGGKPPKPAHEHARGCAGRLRSRLLFHAGCGHAGGLCGMA